MVDITIVFMGFINQLITGGHHPEGIRILGHLHMRQKGLFLAVDLLIREL